jgi:hypothetical protein
MEAKARPQPTKPPEGVQWKPTTSNTNWRTKQRTAVEEVEEPENIQPVPEKRVRWADKSQDEAERPARTEMPYKSVRPLSTGVRTHPMFTKENTQANAGSGSGEKAYRVRAPIQRDGVTDEVIDQIHNTEVMVKLGDLFGLSKELREGERLKLTKVRQPVTTRVPAVSTMQVEEVNSQEEEVLLPTEEVLDLPLGHDALDIEELPKVGVFVTTTATGDMPVGSIVAQDPYLQYLENLPPEERPRQVYVARESAPLQVVYPVINHNDTIESVLDSGSQIVSMSLDSAKQSGLVWDPGLRIFMESANKTMEESVGMARNVPFRWGTLTVYLQVHIIKNPAYKVLLGRPFDLLTRSCVENSGDGGQVVTITDPNTGKKCAIPTFDRGAAKRKAEEDNRPDPSKDQGSNPKSAAFASRGFHRSSRN